jgi:hypothetical protein
MGGHLTKIRGGKKGQISRMIRFLCFFAAARVTTEHAVFGVNRYLMDASAFIGTNVEFGKHWSLSALA